MVQQYQTRTRKVEAIKFTGENRKDVHEFCNGFITETPEGGMFIEGSEGFLKVDRNYWVVKDPSGEIYSIRPELFEQNYELTGN